MDDSKFTSICEHHRPLHGYSRRETIRWWSELVSTERYPVYCILLTTPLETETTLLYGNRCKDYADIVDAMSGPFIAVLTLVDDESVSEVRNYAATTCSSHVYRFADAFGIDYDKLPALVFFTNINKSAYVVISLKGVPAEKLVAELQSIFGVASTAIKEGKSVLETLRQCKRARSFRRLQKAAIAGLEIAGKATIKAVIQAVIRGLAAP